MQALATFPISEYQAERDKPMPDYNHSLVQVNLSFLLKLGYRHLYRILSEPHIGSKSNARVPDLAICSPRKFDPDQNEIRLKDAPLCVIEILSDQQAMTDLLVKRFEYFDFGVKSYWLILPATQTVYVYKTATDFDVFSKKEILKDEQLGIRLKLAEIFE